MIGSIDPDHDWLLSQFAHVTGRGHLVSSSLRETTRHSSFRRGSNSNQILLPFGA